jgi:hypothetical protein
MKLSKNQADALRKLGRYRECNSAQMRYSTADSLVRRGLARFTRDTWWLTTLRDWSVSITTEGIEQLVAWDGAEKWLTLHEGKQYRKMMP